MEKESSYFDQKKLYETEILPHITAIKKICVVNHIPCFTCVAVANTKKDTTYKYDGVLTGCLDLQLTNDTFSRHLCVANGFEIKNPNKDNNFQAVEDFLSENAGEDTSIEEIPQELLE